MKIEQAKALKVGDEIVLAVDSWDDMRIGISYKVTRNGESKVGFIDDVGDTRYCKHEALCVDFTLPPQATPTQWIPFDRERMSEAEGYRASDTKEVITELNIYHVGSDIDISCLARGCVVIIRSIEVEMLVPVVVKYPCLCWAANTSSTQYVAAVLIYSEDETSEMYKYKAGNGNSYKHATPLTTAELAEIGLKQIS